MACKSDQFDDSEYKALRAELDRRSATRYQILLSVFTLFGVLLSIQLSSDNQSFPIIFVFPIVQYLLLGLWSHNFRRTMQISQYIAENLEPADRGWEKAMKPRDNMTSDQHFASSDVIGLQTLVTGAGGIIIGVVSQGIGPLDNALMFWVVLAASIGSLVLSILEIRKSSASTSRDKHLNTAAGSGQNWPLLRADFLRWP